MFKISIQLIAMTRDWSFSLGKRLTKPVLPQIVRALFCKSKPFLSFNAWPPFPPPTNRTGPVRSARVQLMPKGMAYATTTPWKATFPDTLEDIYGSQAQANPHGGHWDDVWMQFRALATSSQPCTWVGASGAWASEQWAAVSWSGQSDLVSK
jgi:hypothetical protein